MSRGAILPPEIDPLERFLTGAVVAFHLAVKAVQFALTIMAAGVIVGFVAVVLSLFKGVLH